MPAAAIEQEHWSAVDYGRVPFIGTLAGCRCETVWLVDLLGAELDAVGGDVFFDAGDAGSLVDYEGTSQFSREYSRLFGAPPQRDVRRMRVSQTASRQ